MLQHLVQEGVALAQDLAPDDLAQRMPMLTQNVMQAAGIPPPQANPGQAHRAVLHDHDQGEALTPQEPRTYAYDEWDFCAAAYKPSWCMVKEKVLEEGKPTFYNEALKTYNTLLSHIKRQFERLILPDGGQSRARLPAGDVRRLGL